MLARVNIPGTALPRRLEYPYRLSGGMWQRVMIAMALACHPALLIADEPTTAFDSMIQAHILDLILGLQDELAMGLLFITHNLVVVSKIADRVMVMYAGRIVEQGSVAMRSCRRCILIPIAVAGAAFLGSRAAGVIRRIGWRRSRPGAEPGRTAARLRLCAACPGRSSDSALRHTPRRRSSWPCWLA